MNTHDFGTKALEELKATTACPKCRQGSHTNQKKAGTHATARDEDRLPASTTSNRKQGRFSQRRSRLIA